MRLDRIIRNSGCTITVGDAFVEIDAVCNDSRKVTRGSAFVAVKGYATDGHDYISIAIGKGAKAIIYEDQAALDRHVESMDLDGVTLIKAESSRFALAMMAANFYDNPSEKLTLVGITGTN